MKKLILITLTILSISSTAKAESDIVTVQMCGLTSCKTGWALKERRINSRKELTSIFKYITDKEGKALSDNKIERLINDVLETNNN